MRYVLTFKLTTEDNGASVGAASDHSHVADGSEEGEGVWEAVGGRNEGHPEVLGVGGLEMLQGELTAV